MNIDWAAIVEKVPEIVIVLLFVWFTLRLFTEFKDFLTERDAIFFKQLQIVSDVHNKEMERLSLDLRKQTSVLSDVLEQMGVQTTLLKDIAGDIKRDNR